MPKLNETYYALKGHGSYVNGQKMQVSSCSEISKAFLATGFISDFEDVIAEQLKVFSKLVRQARGIRRAGAAAYDLTQVAKGVFDGYWEKNLKPWDSAAGILLVEEAGGRVTNYKGQKYNPYDNSIIAAGPTLIPQLLSYF
jgi:myo-inositol-1(or 4)-monophosphatase